VDVAQRLVGTHSDESPMASSRYALDPTDEVPQMLVVELIFSKGSPKQTVLSRGKRQRKNSPVELIIPAMPVELYISRVIMAFGSLYDGK
jgi:hypothetical protein